MSKFRCKHKFPAFLLSLAIVSGFLWWSSTSLQTESFDFTSSRLPGSFSGYRIVVLSDLHGARFGDGNSKLFQTVKQQQPDIIVFVGDIVDRFRGINWDHVELLAAGLRQIAPVYYVTGNHEWAFGRSVPKLKRVLSTAGWTVLTNTYVPLRCGKNSIILAGIDDPNGYADQKTPEDLARELYAAEGHPFWILLAHRNDRFKSQYSLLGADLTISGHGHGGMIRFPFTDGLLGTRRNWLPSYTSGFYKAHGHTVFVSRGLGNSGPSFRLFNRPQVAVLTLKRG